MATVLVAMGFLAVAFVFMAAALHFAQYKKRQQGCCGDALEMNERTSGEDACTTCPRREDEKASCDGFVSVRESLTVVSVDRS